MNEEELNLDALLLVAAKAMPLVDWWDAENFHPDLLNYWDQRHLDHIAAFDPETVCRLIVLLQVVGEHANDLQDRLDRVRAFIDGLEQFGAVYGPVDGLGNYDLKGDMMVDMPMASLVADLRAAMSGVEPVRTPRNPRDRDA